MIRDTAWQQPTETDIRYGSGRYKASLEDTACIEGEERYNYRRAFAIRASLR